MHARRVTIEKEITINEAVSAEALNISRTGIFVLCQHDFAEGAVVGLKIELAGVDYQLPGRVERVERGLGFGVRFVDLPDETAEFLERYEERRAKLRWDGS